jgi:hypothetical protein
VASRPGVSASWSRCWRLRRSVVTNCWFIHFAHLFRTFSRVPPLIFCFASNTTSFASPTLYRRPFAIYRASWTCCNIWRHVLRVASSHSRPETRSPNATPLLRAMPLSISLSDPL